MACSKIEQRRIKLVLITRRLEALAVDNGWARLVVLLLGDPHLLEGGEGREDGTTDPDGVLALWWGDDLDLHGGWGKVGDLLLHTVGDSGVHGGATGKNDVGVQVLTDVDVALHDRVVGGLVDSGLFHTDEGWLEEGLGATESLVSDGDDLSVGKLVALLEGGALAGGAHLLLEVESDVAELLLDVTNDFTLGGGGEAVSTLGQDLHEVVSQIATSQVQTEDGVGESVTLVDGDGVGDTISRVEHDTSGASRGVQREHSLDGNVHGRGVEGLEHDLSHLLTVGLGVEGGLGKEDGVLLGGNTELVVESVVPDLRQKEQEKTVSHVGCHVTRKGTRKTEMKHNFAPKNVESEISRWAYLLHVIPVGDDTVLDRVLQGKDTTLALGFVSDVGVLLAHADHDTLVAGTTDDGGEDSTGCVVTGETGLAHTGAIVYNKSGNVVVTHFGRYGKRSKDLQRVKQKTVEMKRPF